MVDHMIITAGFPGTKQSEAQTEKLAAWVITTGKSCSQLCFPRSFEYCIFLWTGIWKD